MIYEVKDLTFSYPQGDRKVLDGASLTLDKGEILCILGPNGAGKTTLLNCMAGLLKAESGEINICGRNIKDMKEREVASLVGYVPQVHTPAFDYRVIDFVLMGRAHKIGMFGSPDKKDEEICREALKSMGIEHLAEKSYINISGGERQQVMIARTIVQEPKAILFDEPTAHLDYGNQHKVLKRVKQMAQEGYSVIMTTHNPDHALMLNDKVAVVSRNGKIYQGHSDEIITEERLSDVYNIDLKITYVEEIGRKTCFVPGL